MAKSKHMTCICDKCKNEFKLKHKLIKVKVIVNQITGERIERHFFNCSKCRARYIFMYQDDEIKQNMVEMNLIKQKASELRCGDPRYERLMHQYEKLYFKNITISESYKKIYGS